MHTKTIAHDGSYDQPPPDDRPTSATVSLVAGVAAGIGAMGAVLALAGIDSPLRAPFTLFFLLMAPAGALAVVLGRMDPLGRAVAAGAGALAVDLLVAQTMLALHLWSLRGGVLAVAALSGALLLVGAVRRRARRAPGSRAD
ncbi:hypothetical protein OG863_31645 [Streptomyces decoyicus]|uniref:Integral membrane protein n=1 Tax=Streptomyces decoyicus TaxID=249567 RepID=A0ABZ1FNX9_9ACTN|nr:hypothetical protein [Streptomyces decoyicus]WSB72135.1 hypothetical protein OG863_31645 [Streptomyces decoyicus]